MTKLPPLDPQRKTARQFVTRLLATATAVVLGCGLLNAVVDPYGLFRWVDLEGFNAIKPRATQVGAAFKYRVIDFGSPQTLLLGNSRAEMGWDPDLLPPATFGSVANAALPGQGLGAMVALAEHAWVRSRPTTLIIGLEFFDCLESGPSPPASKPTTSPWSATATGPLQALGRLGAFAAETLSLDTIADSLRTLLAQRNPDAAHLRRDGFQPARDYPRMQAIDGPRTLFLQRDQENARTRMNGPRSVRYGNGEWSACFDALDRLLADAQARGQRVYLATYPYHARLLELIVNAGLWPAYEAWKTQITERVARRREGGLSARLWDFGAYHDYAVEAIPRPGHVTPIPRWYWESGHFRSELGARMFNVMTGKHVTEGSFGVDLTPDRLVSHLAAVRASRTVFAATQPEIVDEMATLAKRACRASSVPAERAPC